MNILKQIKSSLGRRIPWAFERSLELAIKEQGLAALKCRLEKIIPDIKDQYSSVGLTDSYLISKVRNMHAFQISLVEEVINEFESPLIIDIGDSSGTHILYLQKLFPHIKNLQCLSVNLDKEAVEKITRKGLKAFHGRAEDLVKKGMIIDICLCFQTLEHLFDPANFLHSLASNIRPKYFICTVPYVKRSRMGLHAIRQNLNKNFGAETTHIFELCPEDWELLFQLCGWRVERRKIYYQYPSAHWLRASQPLWRKYDFEGFYGVRLTPDNKWSQKYQDWPANNI